MSEIELYKKDQKEKKQYSLTYAKQNVAIQKARYSLSITQQKLLCYIISDLKITDTAQTEKIFDIKEFYDFIEKKNTNYEYIRDNLKAISNKSWWLKTDDGWDTLVRFLGTVKTSKRSGKVKIKFHEDMLPFLQELNAQNPYTRVKLFYMLTMKSEYSMRLYEIFKSFEKAKQPYTPSIDNLKLQLDCENYTRVADFRRKVIEVAVAEINQKTDLYINHKFVKLNSRAFNYIEFYITPKSDAERLVVDKQIRAELDGQASFFEE